MFKRFDNYASRKSKVSISLSGQIANKISEINSKIGELIELYILQDISDTEY